MAMADCNETRTHLVLVSFKGSAMSDSLGVALGLANHALGLALELVADGRLSGRVAASETGRKQDVSDEKRIGSKG